MNPVFDKKDRALRNLDMKRPARVVRKKPLVHHDNQYLGRNNRGQKLAFASLNEQSVNRREKVKGKRLLSYQVAGKTPFHKDPYKVSGIRQLPSRVAHDKDLDSMRYNRTKALALGDLGISGPMKYSGFTNPAILKTQRGSDDRHIRQTNRRQASSRAENNRLILDRPYQ
tara:strand:- start:9409 stop:9918 length:510 start_codon:yes stop_codon:yes gene_type:complete